MTKLNEKQIIDLFVSKFGKNKVVGFEKDDVAVLPLKTKIKIKKKKKTKSSTSTAASTDIATSTTNLILKCDMLVESTDVPPGMRPWQIARKSIVSCISDLSAKGIKPPYISLISIGIPKKYSKAEIVDLANGFQLASKEFKVKIVGGDTNKSNELIIDCNIVGISDEDDDENSNIPKRKGARPGDVVICSGEFGYSSSGLKILIGNAKAKGEFRKKAILSVIKPKPQQRFGISLAKYFSSSIDSSDGLAISLYELAKQSSKVNFIIDIIPSANGVKAFAKDNHLMAKDLIFYGGEEYEIVATIPQLYIKKAEALARKLKLKLHVIGKVEKGNGKVFAINENGRYSLLDDRGYMHFGR
jgi:thiamine-monophosphate kinase